MGDDRKRACLFVQQKSLSYGLSSPDITVLGGREVKSLPDLYSSDFHWAAQGRMQPKPQPVTRIVIELFPSVSPLACQNFHSLCTGSKGLSKQSGLPLHYKGCRLHRLLPGFILQGGDLQFGNGSGGESIWGGRFKDDPRGLKMRHDCAGVLSMGNSGKHANSSQFFVTLAEQGAPQCDKKHVVFGRVVSGMEVLQLVQRRAAPIEGGEEPCVPLTVVECGAFTAGMHRQGHWGPDDEFVPLTT